jgi:nucleoside-diphosphate-sugar epimerase
MDMNSISTVMITGAGGFLGTELLHQLSMCKKYNIIALSSNIQKIYEEFQNREGIKYYSVDDLSKKRLPWKDIDVILHCAFARTYEGYALANSIDFTANILLKARNEGVRGFVNISSQSVYGEYSELPWNEITMVSPFSTYAMAKYASEVITKIICEDSEMNYTNIRLSSLVGPGFDVRLVSKFVINAIKNEPIKIIGGNQKLSYMHVKDAAEGLVALLNMGIKTWRSIYNLGSTNLHTVKEIADMVKKIAPLYGINNVTIEIEPKSINVHSEMDSSMFYNDTGWVPKYDMEAIIKSLFEYYIKQH